MSPMVEKQNGGGYNVMRLEKDFFVQNLYYYL